MNNIKNIFTVAIMSISFIAFGQTKPAEVTQETTEKTYTLIHGGEAISNSVKINTIVKRAVMTDSDDRGEIDGDRVYPPKVVLKTVKIDNDNDELYDETIKFSYITEDRTDFALVTNNSNIMIAIEEGDNLSILDNQKMLKMNEEDKMSYVFTDENGNEIEFRIETNMKKESK